MVSKLYKLKLEGPKAQRGLGKLSWAVFHNKPGSKDRIPKFIPGDIDAPFFQTFLDDFMDLDLEVKTSEGKDREDNVDDMPLTSLSISTDRS